jgi:hypothetical protein
MAYPIGSLRTEKYQSRLGTVLLAVKIKIRLLNRLRVL